jgi:hypothetical protein
MKKRKREDLKKTFMGSAGWLFADLLLALAMLFLVANTISLPKPPVVHAAAKRKAAPTPIVPLRLEQHYHRILIIIDRTSLSNNDPGERNAIIRQVKAQKFLHNRQAGLIIAYNGASTTDDIGTAFAVDNAVYSILIDQGKHDPTFAKVSQYDPLYILGGNTAIVTLDIFLFA